MGESGNPAKRAMKGRQSPVRRRSRRDVIDVDVDTGRGLVLLDVGGEITGMTAETTDALILSLTNARNEIDPKRDRRPHSRACGMKCLGHDPTSPDRCSKDCPTCGGSALVAAP